MQTVRGNVAMDNFFQAGLIDGKAPGLEGFNFFLIVVYANDIVTDVGKTCPRDKANVARTDNRNIHDELVPLASRRPRIATHFYDSGPRLQPDHCP